MLILGISAFYHDSAAVLLSGGNIVAAAQQERFSRIKHDAGFPIDAIRYVLAEAGISLEDLDAVAFYDKPFLKFERLLETYHAFAPRGLKSFLSAMPVWIKEKLFMKKLLRNALEGFRKRADGRMPLLLFPEHHLSHAASAFYPSPYLEAAILTVDGVGEWATTTIGQGRGNEITILREIHFPHSLGLMYSAFTAYCGFKVNSGEYKLMGLAPYGNPDSERTRRFVGIIRNTLIDIREDGSFLLNMDCFDYPAGQTMYNRRRWNALFDLPRRSPENEITQPYMDMALAAQQVTEEIVSRLARTARALTGYRQLVMAGGVALNCVANAILLRQNTFEDIWIQPAAGDAGGALGAAYAAYYIHGKKKRTVMTKSPDAMHGAYLGPEFKAPVVAAMAVKYAAEHTRYDDFERLCKSVAGQLANGKVVGWFQGRMEWGPRALGNRSILGDPRHPEMQKRLNLKIKYREGFRPFAPSVIMEDAPTLFDIDVASPYMLLVAPVREQHRRPLPDNYADMGISDRLHVQRSTLPVITHVDFSARIQTVHKETNERYWRLIRAFKNISGFGLVVNTSFNVRGEPIVCTPEDAYRCFMRTEMDCLVIGDFVFFKPDQPEWLDKHHPQEIFAPD
ncbi:MAG: carbamoyltransferase [Pseudomonadota bacterium]